MIINSGIQYRSIAAQREFSFSFDVAASNSSGISQIGFSGDSGVLPLFELKSGNIFDINKKNIWSYNPREVVIFSGNIGSNYINYFINDNPICLFSPKDNGYYYDHWYIKTNGSTLDYDLLIKGEIPQYSFIFPDSIYFGQNISGLINNDSIPEKSFKIFSGTLFSNNINYRVDGLPLFIISGNQSGQIILEPNFSENISILSPIISNLNLLLNTNFGDITYQTSLNVIPASIYYLELFTGYTGATGLIDNFTYGKYYNYELRSILPQNENVSIFLRNISGHTGQLIYDNFEISGIVSGFINGFIHGSDYLTGRLTGLGSAFLSTDYYGNYPTGIFTTDISNFSYATGVINYYYNLPLPGGSGFGRSLDGTRIIGSGLKSGNLTESLFIFQSGLFPVNVTLTGFYNGVVNIIDKIENIPIYFTGNINLNYGNYFWSGFVTGINFTGFSNKIYGITGSQQFLIQGDPFDPNTLGYKNYNDTIYLNQKTGTFLIPLINKNNGLFVNSGTAFSSFINVNPRQAFTGDNYFYFKNQTGFVGIQFSNYSSNDKDIVKYCSFSIDYNTKFFPYIFNLEYSVGGSNWLIADSITGSNFYTNDLIILKLKNSIPSNYEFIRLNVISGRRWQHHYLPENNFSEFIGIKNLEIYGERFFDVLTESISISIVPNLCGYFSSDICSSSIGSILSDSSVFIIDYAPDLTCN